MNSSELQSKTISYLRFPLIVGVVFIHNNISTINIQGEELVFENPQWYYNIIYLINDAIAGIAVPLFFFISGYLFFYNENFSFATYKRKIKSRTKSLLIPYLFWNLLGFLILLIKHLPQFAAFFPRIAEINITPEIFFKSFWDFYPPNEGGISTPINIPFWFIRDLIIIVIFTPVIKWLITYLKLFFPIILFICWYFNIWPDIRGINSVSVFFFSMGAYLSINRLNITDCFKPLFIPTLVIYPLLAFFDVYYQGATYHSYIHNGGIMTGLIMSFNIVSYFLSKHKIHVNKFLTDSSFFIFAIHCLFISELMKITIKLLQPNSAYTLIMIYFLIPFVTIIISLFLYKLSKTLFPKFTSIITGGR